MTRWNPEAAPPVTAHTETAALWGVLNDDPDEARRLVGDMTPREVSEFYDKLNEVSALCWQQMRNP